MKGIELISAKSFDVAHIDQIRLAIATGRDIPIDDIVRALDASDWSATGGGLDTALIHSLSTLHRVLAAIGEFDWNSRNPILLGPEAQALALAALMVGIE